VIIELHANDDSEKSGDDWHERMLAKPFVGCDGLTDLSLSRERPSRASVPDSWRLAKHEGLQARASIRPRVGGCSEELGGRADERFQSADLISVDCEKSIRQVVF